MAQTSGSALPPAPMKHACYAGVVLASGLVFYATLLSLLRYSLQNSSSSHIILIPFVSLFLLYFERERIFAAIRPAIVPGACIIAFGLVLFAVAAFGPIPKEGNWFLSAETLAIVVIWIGAFMLLYGIEAFKAAAFALFFLLLMVPLPDPILNWLIYRLQDGSTDIAYFIFRLTGTPVLRNGFQLTLPTVTIEVAEECSSIRSSAALFITCLLAAHLYLRTGWKKWGLVLLAFPVSLIKNGIRIATLTLLSIYVDPDFLTGSLHHQGGIVFFLVALMLLLPVFLWFERTDKRSAPLTPAKAPNG